VFTALYNLLFNRAFVYIHRTHRLANDFRFGAKSLLIYSVMSYIIKKYESIQIHIRISEDASICLSQYINADLVTAKKVA
jgi:hypothetical protein